MQQPAQLGMEQQVAPRVPRKVGLYLNRVAILPAYGQICSGVHANSPRMCHSGKYCTCELRSILHPVRRPWSRQPATWIKISVQRGIDSWAHTCRAARYCHAGAHGGQIAAPLDLVQAVISSWCGIECPPMTDPPSTHHIAFQEGPLAEGMRPLLDSQHGNKEFAAMPEVSGRGMSRSYRQYPGWGGVLLS